MVRIAMTQLVIMQTEKDKDNVELLVELVLNCLVVKWEDLESIYLGI